MYVWMLTSNAFLFLCVFCFRLLCAFMFLSLCVFRWIRVASCTSFCAEAAKAAAVCSIQKEKKNFITWHKSATKYSRAMRLEMFVSAGCSVAQFGWTCAKWSLSSDAKTARLWVFFCFFFVSFNRNASTAERCVVVAAVDWCEAL